MSDRTSRARDDVDDELRRVGLAILDRVTASAASVFGAADALGETRAVTLDGDLGLFADAVRTALIDRQPPTEEQRRKLAQQVETRLQAGVTPAELGIATRQFYEQAWNDLVRTGNRIGITRAAQERLAGVIFELWGASSEITTEAVGRFEAERASRDLRRATDFLERVLLESPAGIDHATLAAWLDPSRQYAALHIEAEPDRIEVVRANLSDMYGYGDAVVGIVRGAVVAVVLQRPRRILPDTFGGIGPIGPVKEMASSYAHALRAARTARMFGARGLFVLGDIAIRAGVASDRQVGQALVERFITPLGNDSHSRTVVETVKTYIEYGLRPKDAAAALFIHVNTLRQRLRRFEERTGADFGNINDVFGIWWAVQYASLLATPDGAENGSPSQV